MAPCAPEQCRTESIVGIACLILFFPSKNRVNGYASPTDSSKVDSSGPYSLTAVPALEVKPPIARKLRKMGTPMVWDMFFAT